MIRGFRAAARALAITAATAAPTALAQSVTSFTLVNAATDVPIPALDPLEDGAVINLAAIGAAQLNIVANTDPATVGSVVFSLTGPDPNAQTENVAPYALFGDSSGDFNAWAPPLGDYTLTATPYPSASGAGAPGDALTVAFSIINQTGPVNDPPTVDAGPGQTLPEGKTTTTLSGAATDDSAVASVLWSQVAGPPAMIAAPAQLSTTASGLTEAVYIFRLTATDDEDASASDDVTVRVGDPPSDAVVSGELRQWRTLTLTFPGPEASETGDPNPFLDYRLDVTFTNGGETSLVPGYYAADGDAITTGASSGGAWRVRFTPSMPGEWTYTASFRTGPDVAVADDPLAGDPTGFDGDAGVLDIDPADPSLPGFFGRGRLVYDGGHYLRTLGDGAPFVKGGVDSPENWLGYTGFDNTTDGGAGPNTPDGLHAFPTHAADWNTGDPDWDRNDPPGVQNGREIIGALNYLHSTGVNSIYFLPMNIGGDARDSWPYVGPINPAGSTANDNTRFDVSKLEQWDVVFTHAQRLGILLHVVLNEAEEPNKRELDDAQLGTERRLFYRELVARFGHHNAIVWNLCEEYNLGFNLGAARILEWAGFIKWIDPYAHPVTVHNAGNPANTTSGPWSAFIGQDNIDLTSLQDAGRTSGWDDIVEDYRAATAAAGKPIPVMIDEPGSPTRDFGNDYDAFRKALIWTVLLSGGGGEWFINNRDQSLEDFREFDQLWRDTGRAVRFIEDHLPIDQMTPADGLISGATPGFDGPQVMALAGEIYAAHLPNGGAPSLDLGASDAAFDIAWFNPRADEPLQTGSVATVAGPGVVALGEPPADPGDDWVVLVTRRVQTNPADLSGDGSVGTDDLGILLADWGQTGSPADLDGDGVVGSGDLGELLAAWD